MKSLREKMPESQSHAVTTLEINLDGTKASLAGKLAAAETNHKQVLSDLRAKLAKSPKTAAQERGKISSELLFGFKAIRKENMPSTKSVNGEVVRSESAQSAVEAAHVESTSDLLSSLERTQQRNAASMEVLNDNFAKSNHGRKRPRKDRFRSGRDSNPLRMKCESPFSIECYFRCEHRHK
jgi:hypothetical protein